NALRSGDTGFVVVAEWMLGHTKHQLGRLKETQKHFTTALDSDSEESRLTHVKVTGYDRHTDLLGIMANTLWILGMPEQAQRWNERAIAEAHTLQMAMPLGVAMIWTGLNKYLAGTDIGAFEQDMVELLEHGRSYSVDSEVAFALSFLGLCQA